MQYIFRQSAGALAGHERGACPLRYVGNYQGPQRACERWVVYPGDFDGDGRSDLFSYNSLTGEWLIAISMGTGFTYSHGLWSPEWTVSIGDLDGDGRSDVFLYMPRNGEWYECLNTGSGGFHYAEGF